MDGKKSSLRLLLACLAIVFWCCTGIVKTLGATEPPRRGEIKRLIRSREFRRRLEFVRRLGNHRVDSDLLKRALNRAERKRLESKGIRREEIDRLAPLMAPPPGRRGVPTRGNVRALALLIEFHDVTHANTQNFIHTNLFRAGDPNRSPYESLAVYYDRSSYNQLNLGGGDTLGWYQTTYNRSAVPQTDAGRDNLIKEALNHYDAQGFDFSPFDNDGDGVIDYFLVFWTGADTGWGTFWWGYQTSFSDTSYKIDNKTLGKYSWQWEASPAGGTFTPITAIHETGHALGLPDYYDYDDTIGPRGGVGGLDMMAANMGDHNCFSKWLLDWLAPVYLFAGSQNLSLAASGASQNCVMMWPPTAPNVFSEYFMVQNRQRVANDNAGGMPGDGMVIWHVDGTLDASGGDFACDNSFTAHKLLRLMEADGQEHIEAGLWADANDYYKAGSELSSCSKPSSKKYDGSETGIKISNFSAPGATMSALFEHGATAFTAVYAVGDNGSAPPNGIAGYDLLSDKDRVLVFDFNHDSWDDLFLYRPGNGAAWVARSNKDGTFTAVYAVGDNGSAAPNGIAGYDLLSDKDRVLVFDYNNDNNDDLFLYRPGNGAAWVAKSNGNGTFTAVYAVGDNGSAAPNGIAGYDLLSDKDRVLVFDYNNDNNDDLFLYRPGNGAAWVAKSNGNGTFTAVYAVGDNGSAAPNGIAGYDLLSDNDRVLVFDYNGDGYDDLFLYRPGNGAAWVAKSNGDGTFTAVYAVGDNGSAEPNGIAGFDLLSENDQVVVFDYNGDGYDDLFLYRPGNGAAWVAKSNGDGTFTAVYAVGDNGSAEPNGIAGFDLLSENDQVVVFDYNGDGYDDLFLYRPGNGAAWVAKSNGDGTFTAVYAVGDNGSAAPNGIAGYDMLSIKDRAVPFDYNGDGYDDLFFYRPGNGAAWVAQSNGDGTFTPVYSVGDNGSALPNGIAGYDMLSNKDQALAFDFDGDGNKDLFLYRHGNGAAWVVKSNCK